MSKIYFPRLLRRIQAMLIDAGIWMVLIYGMIVLVPYSGIESGRVKLALMFIPFFIYEPLLVTFAGGTIGHHLRGLKVRRSGKEINLNIILSSVRFLIKYYFGIFSLLLILVTKKHQALHDLITNSIVIHKSIDNLPDYEIKHERS